VRWPVFSALVLHGFASSVLGPAIAAISLMLVGRALLGERVGRNVRFASTGNGVAAFVMGLVGLGYQRARFSASPPRWCCRRCFACG